MERTHKPINFGILDGLMINPEVEFVHPVSAGGSVKFLPAV